MLLLVDLDNTLVDRASAFNLWATTFVRSLGGSDLDDEWLIAADRDGYEPRESLARAIKDRFDTGLGIEDLAHALLLEHVDLLTIDPGTISALRRARSSGWKIGVVTNGSTAQQTLKIQVAGLEPYVDAVVISEAEQVKKPDPGIFAIAAKRLLADPADGWMVGDHPTADIAGGRAAGLRTGWVSRGKEWPSGMAAPDLSAPTAAEVINAVVRSDAQSR
ncbi:HAD family hydrolase [Arthrobacter sp. 35W]|uniref:HAD family hydrolase n=1 Tax=Arthrobacter sp. 35W TaxID=1132441 RepID=UPI00054E0A71|nr:HAD family hydrolase [Arthrobacter sp. 35W]